MLVIHKQPLQPGLNHLSLPMGSTVLHADMQYDARRQNQMHIWYLRPQIPAALENRTFLWIGTGQDMDEPGAGQDWTHIATSIDNFFVWHVFELVNTKHEGSPGEQLAGEGR